MLESHRTVIVELSLETLARGRVVDLVDKKLAEALAHCRELPDLEKVREVTLQLLLKPALEEGEFNVNVGTRVTTKLPVAKGPVDRATLRDGRFEVFNVPGSSERQSDITDFTTVKQQRSVAADGSEK